MHTMLTRKLALTRFLSDTVGRLLVSGAKKQMSASQLLVFLLRPLLHHSHPEYAINGLEFLNNLF